MERCDNHNAPIDPGFPIIALEGLLGLVAVVDKLKEADHNSQPEEVQQCTKDQSPRRANNGGTQDAVLDEGEWPLRRLAEELGMSKTGLRGWVIARQEQQPPWRWIVWAGEEELKRLRELRALPRGYHVRNKLWLE